MRLNAISKSLLSAMVYIDQVLFIIQGSIMCVLVQLLEI